MRGAQGWEKQTDSESQGRDWSVPKWVDRNIPAPVSDDLPADIAEPSASAGEQSVGVDGSAGAEESSSPVVSAGVDVSSPAAKRASEANEEGLHLKPAVSASEQGAGEDGGPGLDEFDSPAVSAHADESSSSPAAECASETKEEGLHLKLLEESHMPAWAQKVLNQSAETGIETIVVVDDDGAAAAVDGDDPGHRPLELGSVESGTAAGGKDSDQDPQVAGVGLETNLSGKVPGTPRSGRQKFGIRMVEGTSISQETEEPVSRRHIQVLDGFLLYLPVVAFWF